MISGLLLGIVLSALVDSIIWLSYLRDLFLLILAHAYARFIAYYYYYYYHYYIVKFTLEQAKKSKKESRGIALLFL
jgi:hypothetical protein